MPYANDYRALPCNQLFKAESLLIISIGHRPMTKNPTKRKTVGQRPTINNIGQHPLERENSIGQHPMTQNDGATPHDANIR